MSKEGVRVRIVGDHPWAGHAGLLVSVDELSIGILPKMGRVVLDPADDVPSGHECYALPENLQALEPRRKGAL